MWQDWGRKGEETKQICFETYFKFTSPDRIAFSIAILSKNLQGQQLCCFFPKEKLGLHEQSCLAWLRACMYGEVEKEMSGLEETRKLQCKCRLQTLHHTTTISSAAQANC